MSIIMTPRRLACDQRRLGSSLGAFLHLVKAVQARIAHPSGFDDEPQKSPTHQDRGEQADDYSKRESECKPLNNARAEGRAKPVQYETRDQCGKIRIANRRPGAIEAGVDRAVESTTRSHLLFHPLKNQDIRVDRHANRQNKASNPRQGQRYRDQAEKRERYRRVNEQGKVGQNSWYAVVQNHECQYDTEADNSGENTLPHRLGAEGRANLATVHNLQWYRKRAVLQFNYQVLGLGEGELSSDLTAPTRDWLDDSWGRENLLIHCDCEKLVDVIGRIVGKLLRPTAREDEIDVRLGRGLFKPHGSGLEVGTTHHGSKYLVWRRVGRGTGWRCRGDRPGRRDRRRPDVANRARSSQGRGDNGSRRERDRA